MTDRDTVSAIRPKMSAFEEARARHLDSLTDLNAPHNPGMVDDAFQAKYDRRGLILTLDAEREARADAERPLRELIGYWRDLGAGDFAEAADDLERALATPPAPAPAGEETA